MDPSWYLSVREEKAQTRQCRRLQFPRPPTQEVVRQVPEAALPARSRQIASGNGLPHTPEHTAVSLAEGAGPQALGGYLWVKVMLATPSVQRSSS